MSVICGLVEAEKESQAESEILKLQIARAGSQKTANAPFTQAPLVTGVRAESRESMVKTSRLDLVNVMTLRHSARTAVAAMAAIVVARLFALPETYWAALTTLIVMQSELGDTLGISVRQLVGTVLGVAVGTLLAEYFGSNLLAFGGGLFLLGVLCPLVARTHQRLPEYLDKTAYRYASVALIIVMLVVRYNSAWVVALHRFIEVSIGITVGLVLTLLWPEREHV